MALSRITLLTRSFSRYRHTSMTDAELDQKYVQYFNNADSWQVRQGMTELHGLDMVPEPKIVEAALRAARRLNDYALAVRILESVKWKCGPHVDKIWPYMLQELQPTLDELGIETPEQMGYDKPELALRSVYDSDYSEK